MVKSTAALVFFLLLAAASAAPHDVRVRPPPPGSVINQTFYIFPPFKDNNPGDDGGNDSEVDPITNIGVNQTELLELGIKLIEVCCWTKIKCQYDC